MVRGLWDFVGRQLFDYVEQLQVSGADPGGGGGEQPGKGGGG